MINQRSLLNLFSRLTKQQSGFTLTELLVTIIIGGLIVTSVTAILNDVVRASKREEVLTATQQDMKRALDFMEADLKGAAYIYTGEEIRNARGNVDALSSYLDTNDDYEIVLAFWKPEPIPYTPAGGEVPEDCDDDSIVDLTPQQCRTLQVERRTYTLVVYVQDTNPSDTWEGKSIIRRYQLRKFENETFTQNGRKFLNLKISEHGSNNDEIYVDPVKEANGFPRWPEDLNNNNLLETSPVINEDTSAALVDFVDDPSSDPGGLPTCLDEDTNNNGSLDAGEDDPSNGGNGNGVLDVYSRTPASDQSKSFFACVRQPGFQGDFSQGNQDIIIYLRGNPDGRSDFRVENDTTPLPTLQTQVMLRGVVDKFVN